MKKLTKAHVVRANRRMFQAVVDGNVEAFRNAIEDGANISAKRYGYPVGVVACGVIYNYDLLAEVSLEILLDLLRLGLIEKRKVDETCMRSVALTPACFDALYEVEIDRTEQVIDELVLRGNIDLWNHCKDRISISTARAYVEASGWITPLHKTLVHVQPNVRERAGRIDALLDAGCGIEDLAAGDTPLILAIKCSDVCAVEALLRRGAKTEVSDGWGRTLNEVIEETRCPLTKSIVSNLILSKNTANAASHVARRRL